MSKRPDNIEFPKVWLRFERKLQDGTVKKFKIQDVTEDMYDDVTAFMEENFLKEEPFTLTSGVLNDEKSLKQLHSFWKNFVLPQRVSLICLEDNEDARTFMKPEIIGFNFLILASKNLKKPVEYSEPPQLAKILDEVDSRFNIYSKYNVKEFLTAAGLAVNKGYRGMKIGAELLNARTPLCKAIGIKVTETIFSATGSQILASRAGFETLVEIKYEDLEKKLKLKFPVTTKTVKVMVKIID